MSIVLDGTSGITTPTEKVVTTIGVGNATPSASGAGITFPATQSASTDANTLDDYEEGTWTPNQGAGLTVVGTFSSTGTYTKIGRVVNVRGTISAVTSITCTSAGAITSNLPFSSPVDTAGSYFNGALTAGGVVDTSGLVVYPAGAIAATVGIYFNITYQTS